MRLIPHLFWPASRRGQLLLWFCAGSVLLALTLAFVDHPVAYVVRVKAVSLFAGEPEVALAFKREPAERPVLGSGTAERPMIVMDPCVVADAEGFHLFFTSFFCDTRAGLSPFWKAEYGEQFDTRKLTTGLAYAFSADRGKNWTVRPSPLLLPVVDGWDNFRVETASAIVRRGILHLFYCADGKQRPARYQIGEASLALKGDSLREALLVQGRTPSRGRVTPVLAGVTDRLSFRNNVQEPSALFFGGHFELYFVGLQLTKPREAVDHPGQTISRIGLGRALLDNSLNVIEVSEKPLTDLANIIEVKRTDDCLVLFTTLSGEGEAHRRERIGYQTSRDGRRWSRPKELLSSLPKGFDSWGCMSPTVVPEADRWVLFYTALENLHERPEERWGMPLGPDGWLFGTLGRAESIAP